MSTLLSIRFYGIDQTRNWILHQKIKIAASNDLNGEAIESFSSSVTVWPGTVSFHKLLLIINFFTRLLPESLRWLAGKGKHDAARKVVENMSKLNKKPFPEHLLHQQVGSFGPQ